jgi:hypothetical protein
MTRYPHDFDKIQGLPGDEEERLLDNDYDNVELTSYTSIAQYHTRRLRLLNIIFLLIHLAAVALGIIAILMFNSIRLVFPVGSIGISIIFVLFAVFYTRFQEEEVGVLLGSSWLLKSPGAKYVRWFILWNFIMTFFLVGFLYDWFVLVPATEFMGWSVFSLFGCSNPQCGINPNCPAIMNDSPATFWNNPYEMDPKTLPPVDRDDSIDDRRKRGLCVCQYRDEVNDIPLNITNCVPEKYFVTADFVAANTQAVYDTLDISQQGPDEGMYCSALFCPDIGEINPRNANEYTGELMYWTKPLVILYIFLQPILLGLFVIEVLLYGLWALSVLEYEKMLREEELNARRKTGPSTRPGDYKIPFLSNLPIPKMAIDTVIRNRMGVPSRMASAINQGKQKIASLRNPSPPPPAASVRQSSRSATRSPSPQSGAARQSTRATAQKNSSSAAAAKNTAARRSASTSPSRGRTVNSTPRTQRTSQGKSNPPNRSRSQSPSRSRTPSPRPAAKRTQGFYERMYSR